MQVARLAGIVLVAVAGLASSADGFSVASGPWARSTGLRSRAASCQRGLVAAARPAAPAAGAMRMCEAGDEMSDDDDVDMEAFRALLTDQWKKTTKVATEDDNGELDGYKFRDLIVAKWGVPYDVQLQRSVFLGKPMMVLNVMWKYYGQQSFHLTEMEYLEHLQALAELVNKWDRVQHVKDLINESKKRPAGYFGYAVSIPLDLDPEVMENIGGDFVNMPTNPDYGDNKSA